MFAEDLISALDLTAYSGGSLFFFLFHLFFVIFVFYILATCLYVQKSLLWVIDTS